MKFFGRMAEITLKQQEYYKEQVVIKPKNIYDIIPICTLVYKDGKFYNRKFNILTILVYMKNKTKITFNKTKKVIFLWKLILN